MSEPGLAAASRVLTLLVLTPALLQLAATLLLMLAARRLVLAGVHLPLLLMLLLVPTEFVGVVEGQVTF